MIELECRCGYVLQAEDRFAGLPVTCPHCAARVTLPGTRSPDAPPTPGGASDLRLLNLDRLLPLGASAAAAAVLLTVLLPWGVHPAAVAPRGEKPWMMAWDVLGHAPLPFGATLVAAWLSAAAGAVGAWWLRGEARSNCLLIAGAAGMVCAMALLIAVLAVLPTPAPFITLAQAVLLPATCLLLPIILAAELVRTRGCTNEQVWTAQRRAGAALVAVKAFSIAVAFGGLVTVTIQTWTSLRRIDFIALMILELLGLIAGVIAAREASPYQSELEPSRSRALPVLYGYLGLTAAYLIARSAGAVHSVAGAFSGLVACLLVAGPVTLLTVGLIRRSRGAFPDYYLHLLNRPEGF